MENTTTNVKSIRRRLSYRIGDNLPRPLRYIYYAILVLSVVYIIYRLIEWVLKTIQKIGQFIFEDKTYWAIWICIVILIIGALLLGQYYFGLDPFGKISEAIVEFLNNARQELSNAVEKFSDYISPK